MLIRAWSQRHKQMRLRETYDKHLLMHSLNRLPHLFKSCEKKQMLNRRTPFFDGEHICYCYLVRGLNNMWPANQVMSEINRSISYSYSVTPCFTISNSGTGWSRVQFEGKREKTHGKSCFCPWNNSGSAWRCNSLWSLLAHLSFTAFESSFSMRYELNNFFI